MKTTRKLVTGSLLLGASSVFASTIPPKLLPVPMPEAKMLVPHHEHDFQFQSDAESMHHHSHGHHHEVNRSKIQIAVLIDTSNSMDGLINQARTQIWDSIEELSHYKKFGKTPILEVAIFEYGNTNNPEIDGYTRKVSDLTTNLDNVSEALFSLTTRGGDEYAGYAIEKATTDLKWSTNPDDLKIVYIAGNEAVSQGPLSYIKAAKHATQHDIKVNTIFAGPYTKGVELGWRDASSHGNGGYMNINQGQRIIHYTTPYDDDLARLNRALNESYVPYGALGSSSAERQLSQDANTKNISTALLAKRAKLKTSSLYNASSWDLVDALEGGSVSLEEMDTEDLPSAMKALSSKERQIYVDDKKQEREDIKSEIQKLSKLRDEHIKKQNKPSKDKLSFGSAFKKSIMESTKSKGFTLNGDVKSQTKGQAEKP